MSQNHPHPVETRPSTKELLVDLVKTRMLTIAGLLLLAGAGLLYLGFDPGIPRDVRLGLIVAVIVAPLGLFSFSKVKALLPEPPVIWLVDIDALDSTGAIWMFPPSDFNELDVLEGELDQVAPALYFAREVDVEAGTVKGTWRGTMTDRELLTALAAVFECREMLQDDAQKGFALETSLWAIVRQAARDATMAVVETFQSQTLPDEGEGVEKAVDTALQQYDLDDTLDRLEDAEHVDLDELDLDLDQGDRDGLEDTRDVDPEQRAMELYEEGETEVPANAD